MALKTEGRNFPAGPLVKNPPANAEYTSSIPGLVWKDSTCGRATKPACCNYWGPPTHPGSCVLRQEKPLQWEACVLQPESHPRLLLQREKACTQQWRPSVAKKKYIKKKKKEEGNSVGLGKKAQQLIFPGGNNEAVHRNKQMTGTWQGLRDLMGLDRIKRRFFYRSYDYWARKEYEIKKDVKYT